MGTIFSRVKLSGKHVAALLALMLLSAVTAMLLPTSVGITQDIVLLIQRDHLLTVRTVHHPVLQFLVVTQPAGIDTHAQMCIRDRSFIGIT